MEEQSTAPTETVTDNALTAGFTPEQSAAPVEQGQAEQAQSAWFDSYNDDFKGLIEKKGLTGLSQQEAIENITKSYTNLESMKNVSGENLFNLSTDMDDESRERAFNALGRPAQPDQYSYEAQETDNAELVDAAKQIGHKLGMTDKQVSNFIPEINQEIVRIAETHTAEIQAKNNQGLSELQKELGGSWESQLNLATRSAEYFGITEEMQTAIRDTGNSAGFIKALSKIGGLMAEGGMAGMSPQSGSAAMGVMTPEAAKAEIDKKLNDADFMKRYHSRDQATRINASKELDDFRKAAFGK